MPFNGSGIFVQPYDWVEEAGLGNPIDATKFTAQDDGVATGLSNTICRDGQSTISADIPFNNKKITGLGDAAADTDGLNRRTADDRYLQLAEQTLTDAEKVQARANLDVLQKNYIINGAMMVSQENGTTAGTTNGYYPVDFFNPGFVTSGTLSFAQVASLTPAGSPNRLRVTVTAADTSIAAGDILGLNYAIEGLRVADLKSGTASAKTVVLQFGVKAPAGTYCVAFRNSASDRTQIKEYTISGGEANTDVVKSVSLTLDTTGTWANDNTVGLRLTWTLMTGTTFQVAADAWQAGNFQGTSNQFNFMGTISNVFELFDVSLTEGSVAPAFQVPDYASELALCQRYLRRLGDTAQSIFLDGYAAGAGSTVSMVVSHYGMRTYPTWTFNGSATTSNVASGPTFAIGQDNTTLWVNATGTGRTLWYNNAASYYILSARL
jgi:hypothetical protein